MSRFDNSMLPRVWAESSMKVAFIASTWKRGGRAAAALAFAALMIAGAATGAPPARRGAKRAAPDPAAQPKPLPDGVLVPDYSPGPLPFHPGEQLIYQASWIGIPAAGGKVVLHPDYANPAMLTAEIWINTNRLTDKLYRMRDYLRENFAADSLEPAELYIRQNEGRRHDTFDVTFNHRRGVVTLIKHGPRGVQRRAFLSDNPSGPVSAALMALSQPLAAGETFTFDAFSGTTRYVFNLRVVRRERIGTPLGEFDAWRIVPSVSYLSDGEVNDKAHDTVLWVSADARRLPLRVESAVFIGSVRIDLVKIIDGARPESAQD